MKYTFMPLQQMVRVQFDMPLPHIEAIYNDNFGGRNLWLDEHGRWERLECSSDEWMRYLERARIGAQAAGDITIQLYASAELELFRRWMSRQMFPLGAGSAQA